MLKAEAIKTLSEAGYSIAKWEYTTALGADGKVVGTDPPAGTTLAPGSSVSVTVNGTPPL
jgi:beta-lactam-binding protein with PASTA domain